MHLGNSSTQEVKAEDHEFKNNLSYRARNFLGKRENICERRREGERDEKQTKRTRDTFSQLCPALTELLDVRVLNMVLILQVVIYFACY